MPTSTTHPPVEHDSVIWQNAKFIIFCAKFKPSHPGPAWTPASSENRNLQRANRHGVNVFPVGMAPKIEIK